MKDLSWPSDAQNRIEEEFKIAQKHDQRSSLKKFKDDSYRTKEPLTEIMVKVRQGIYVRSENVDYLDKEFMLVN